MSETFSDSIGIIDENLQRRGTFSGDS